MHNNSRAQSGRIDVALTTFTMAETHDDERRGVFSPSAMVEGGGDDDEAVRNQNRLFASRAATSGCCDCWHESLRASLPRDQSCL
eukprot:scaffold6870_cov121-Cylindrotheca_fusiformis.AAC.21